VTQRRIGELKRWGGAASKIAACAIGAGVAVAVIVVGALTASLFAVGFALVRSVGADVASVGSDEGQRLSHPGTASRVRTTALQRAAADEAAR
jgi:hypothetical protein